MSTTVIIRESINVTRKGKRFEPEIGSLYDLEDDEIASLQELRPSSSESGSSAFDLPVVVEKKEAKPAGKGKAADL